MKTKGKDKSLFIEDRRKGKELDRLGSEIIRAFVQPVVPKYDPNRPKVQLTGGPGVWQGDKNWSSYTPPKEELKPSEFRQYRSIEDIITEEVNGRRNTRSR